MNGTVYVTGVAPFAYSGTTWTDTNALKKESLPDSNGTATSIGYEIDLRMNQKRPFSSKKATRQVLANYLATQIAKSTKPPTISTIQIIGLKPTKSYDIALISQGDQSNQGGEFIIDGTLKVSTGSSPEGPLVEGTSYVVFRKVMASSNGTINITWKSRSETKGNFAVINAFQIVPSDQSASQESESASYASIFFP